MPSRRGYHDSSVPLHHLQRNRADGNLLPALRMGEVGRHGRGPRHQHRLDLLRIHGLGGVGVAHHLHPLRPVRGDGHHGPLDRRRGGLQRPTSRRYPGMLHRRRRLLRARYRTGSGDLHHPDVQSADATQQRRHQRLKGGGQMRILEKLLRGARIAITTMVGLLAGVCFGIFAQQNVPMVVPLPFIVTFMTMGMLYGGLTWVFTGGIGWVCSVVSRSISCRFKHSTQQ